MKDDTAGTSCFQVDEGPNTHVAAKFDDDIGKFEEMTFFSTRCYEVSIHFGEREGISPLFRGILDAGKNLGLIGEDVFPTGLISEMKKFDTSLRTSVNTTFLSMKIFFYALI